MGALYSPYLSIGCLYNISFIRQNVDSNYAFCHLQFGLMKYSENVIWANRPTVLIRHLFAFTEYLKPLLAILQQLL